MDFGRMLFNRQRPPRASNPPVISEMAGQEEEMVVSEIIEEAMIEEHPEGSDVESPEIN